jgi:hypothetical protein
VEAQAHISAGECFLSHQKLQCGSHNRRVGDSALLTANKKHQPIPAFTCCHDTQNNSVMTVELDSIDLAINQ